MTKSDKRSAWQLLVEQGLATDRKHAERLILAGLVSVDAERVYTAGQLVHASSQLVVRTPNRGFVGKGGLKLEGALQDFGIDIDGRVCLDTGASTGGFTDCLLKHGACRVYAIDVGYGQLAGKLRVDPRVVNWERTNISDITASRLNPRPDFATVDLSYLSLKKAIPIVVNLLSRDAEILCLVKPLFEVRDAEARRSGQIDGAHHYSDVLWELVRFVHAQGHVVRGVAHSRYRGNSGTLEFFMWVSLDMAVQVMANMDLQIETAVEQAMALNSYKP